MKPFKNLCFVLFCFSFVACASHKNFEPQTNSLTEKQNFVLETHESFSQASVVGWAGNLMTEVEQQIFSNKILERTRKLENIAGVDFLKIAADDNNVMAAFKSDILFEHNKFDLNNNATNILLQIVDIVNDIPNTSIEVVGYTDNTGERDYNLNLSIFRANAVANFLKQNGASKVFAVGRGVENPIDTNASEEGRAKNRRVEIKLTTPDFGKL